MPTKAKYQRGHRGSSLNSIYRVSGRRLDSPEGRPRQENGPAGTVRKPADWGGDSADNEFEGIAGSSDRNGGTRFFRAIDMADRADRLAQGKTKLRYSWRTITGPTPRVNFGDLVTARLYLQRINHAIGLGGWTSSEASGLYLARRIWGARARGEDVRYNQVGNRQGGLVKPEASVLSDSYIVQSVLRRLKLKRNSR